MPARIVGDLDRDLERVFLSCLERLRERDLERERERVLPAA